MEKRLTVEEYFGEPETTNPRELVWGILREPPAPGFEHQTIVTHLGSLLDRHARRLGIGAVVVSPIDVVLDEKRKLVVQPDVVFISKPRLSTVVVGNRVRGAPDLVVEVFSPGCAWRDRDVKLRWYSRYGVQEYWLVDPIGHEITVVALRSRSHRRRSIYAAGEAVRSRVLPALNLPVSRVFE
ncbi:MAG: Uma2 family endonuclease [Acidobacteria bacterium]|nr:Uma2 family endonuclease [Acidobacteriota bacterium]MBI3264138.1 Uma2 family endonuclease [Acidobacteriota bacterium]